MKRRKKETRIKISKALGGSGNLSNPDQVCAYCGEFTTNPKYCSVKCTQLGRIPKEYHRKNYRDRKNILWEEQGKKCNNCGYNLYDQITGPYEIHHIDGDINNRKRENEELLCCNCHFLTDNFRFKGRNHTKESKKLISKIMKNSSV